MNCEELSDSLHHTCSLEEKSHNKETATRGSGLQVAVHRWRRTTVCQPGRDAQHMHPQCVLDRVNYSLSRKEKV